MGKRKLKMETTVSGVEKEKGSGKKCDQVCGWWGFTYSHGIAQAKAKIGKKK